MRDIPSRRLPRILSVVLPVLLLLLAPPLRAEDFPRLDVREHVLPNGFRVLVVERPSTFTVACHLVVAAGSADERAGTTGISHFLQRLLLKGTRHVGTRGFDKEQPLMARLDFLHEQLGQVETATRTTPAAPDVLASRLRREIQSTLDQYRGLMVPDEMWAIYVRNGARDLAQTSLRDYTHFSCSLPADRFELWALMESQRLLEPVFRDFYPEREWVDQERRQRVERDPDGRLDALLWARAFPGHPYRWPVLGQPEDVLRIRRRDVEEHFRACYRPDRMTAVVVGNVRTSEVLALIDKYFGRLPAGDGAPVFRPGEFARPGAGRQIIHGAGAPRLRIGWPAPAARDAGFAAVDVLAEILGGGRVNRLSQALVTEGRLCSSARVEWAGTRDPGLFVIAAMPMAPAGSLQAEQAISAVVRRLQEEPPTSAEVAAAVRGLELDLARRAETNHGLAMVLSQRVAVGAGSFTGEWTAGWRAVGPREVQEAARRIFDAAHRQVVMLEWDGEPQR